MDKHSILGHKDTERFDEEYDDLNQIHQTCGHRFSFDKSSIDNQFSFILLYSLRSSCWENKTPCSSNTESGLSLIINVFYYLLIIHTCFIGHQTKLWLTFSSQVCFIYAARITTTFPQLVLQSGELTTSSVPRPSIQGRKDCPDTIKKNLETGRKNVEETLVRAKQFTVILSKASWNVLYFWFTITWTNHAFIVSLTHCWQPRRAFRRACYGHFVWNHLTVLFLYDT